MQDTIFSIGFCGQFRTLFIPFDKWVIQISAKKNCTVEFVIQLRISVIPIRTYITQFNIFFIQNKKPAGSIQIRHHAGKRLFQHSNSHVGIRIRN